ncbi:TIGR01244 family sulfur transferase [Roseibacterium sp. SDUM158016]|uniref:TIGR01244 family sulfur transferase n=1 Tax=Roseicyclus sediminis TaxID=2980997 RepID=UPI0021CE0D55|nr:TIGR01244 family sulfur transferase [Roseibacterium sp. SDUM158016]MCU4653891.1 TIGR01244 family sulfur transferase [Roseibacterium sp. SDUM158016]
MQIRPIAEGYSVAPQLEPADMAALAAEGVTTVICNRPDMENPPAFQAAAMQQAAEAAGLAFVFNPVTGGMLTEANVEEQAEAIAGSDGPVVAYCASGNRSTIVWALGVAGEMPVDDILARAAAGGYDLAWLRPQLEAMAARQGA